MKQLLTFKTNSLAEAARKTRLLEKLGASYIHTHVTGKWADASGEIAFARGINFVRSVTAKKIFVNVLCEDLELTPVGEFQIIIEAEFREQP